MSNQSTHKKHEVSIRKIPYPYQAMLAICSDLDSTPDSYVYREIMRFLNTSEKTKKMGVGINLEVGNSIYFDTPPDTFSYWSTDDAGRDMIRSLIHSGHIDCLHSFGENTKTRAEAERALEELSLYNCYLKVWVDHGGALSNFGNDIMLGTGDISDSLIYHADLTFDYGIRYVWRGRVTSVIGQDVPKSYRGIWNFKHPFDSAKTLVKEAAKGSLAMLGNAKYAMNGSNGLLREIQLRNGRKVMEFLRSNPHWGGPGCGATSEGIADVLTEQFLDRLVVRRSFCILYTHLGKIYEYNEPFGLRTRQAFGVLAQYFNSKKILVTTTRRLLGYCRALRKIKLITSSGNDFNWTDIRLEGDEEDINGLTLYNSEPNKMRIRLNDREITNLQRNKPDNTNQPSVSFPWKPLKFPDT